MTQQNTTKDNEQSYQLPISRRDLIRGSGAAAGAVAAGAGPSLIDGDYVPVGRAQAIAPLVAIGIGVAGLGVVRAGLDRAEQYSEARAVYNQTRTGISSIDNALTNEAARLGVDFENGDPANNYVVDENQNELVNNTVESYYSEAAAAYDEGATLIEAQRRARQTARQILTSAEWQIVTLWNGFCESLIDAFDSSYSADDFGYWDWDNHVYYSDAGTSGSLAESAPIVWGEGSGSDQYESHIGTATQYNGASDHGFFGIRPFYEETVLEVSQLPESDFPERDQLEVLEMVWATQSTTSYSPVTPYLGVDIDDDDVSDPLDWTQIDVQSADLEDSYSLVVDTDATFEARHPQTDDKIQIPFYKFRALIAAARSHYERIDQNIDSNVADIYDSMESGETELSDYTSLRDVARDADISDETTAGQLAAVSSGQSPPEGMTTATIRIDGGSEQTGTLYLDIESDTLELTAGQTVAPSDHNGGYFIVDDGSTTSLSGDEEIEIVSIEGSDQLSYESREYYGADGVDRSDIKQVLERNQKLYDETQEGIASGLLGPGGLGGGSSNILLVGAAAVGGLLWWK